MPSPYLVNSNSGVLQLSNRAWSLGDRMVPTTSDVTTNVNLARQYVWTATTAGTSTGTPAWPASVTPGVTTVTQNGVVWTASDPGYNVAGAMSHAHATPFLWRYAMRRAAAGEVIYVANTHNAVHGDNFTETNLNGTVQSPVRAISMTFPGDGTSVPTVYTPGAREVAFPSAGINIQVGGWECYGISFGTTTTSGTTPLSIGLTNLTACLLEDGEFIFSDVASQAVVIGASNTAGNNRIKLRNYGLRFANATSRVTLNGGQIDWSGCYVSGSGSTPTAQVFGAPSGPTCNIRIADSDFSNIGSACNLMVGAYAPAGEVLIENCETPVGWTATPFQLNGVGGSSGFRGRWINVGNATTSYQHGFTTGRAGSWVLSDAIYRDGLPGAETRYSLVCTTTAQTSRIAPLEIDYAVDVAAAGTYSAGVELATNGITLTNDDAYVEVSALSDSASPLAVNATNRPGPVAAASNLPASSEAWTGVPGTPVRQRTAVSVTVPRACRLRVRLVLARKSSTIYADPVASAV